MTLIAGFVALILAAAIAGIISLIGKKMSDEQFEHMQFSLWFALWMGPIITLFYFGIILIIYNLTAGRVGWPKLLLPWWPQDAGEVKAVALSSWEVLGILAVIFIAVTVWSWLAFRKP